MKNELLLKLGQKIRYERMKLNLSQEELAELSGLCTQSISTLETGIKDVRFTTLNKLAKALNLELKELLDFKL